MKRRLFRFEPRRARIELIPMIDTMVFLLVFFMIASLAMTQEKGLPVALPKADSAQKATWADRAIVITEKADGAMYLDKKPVSPQQLGGLLAARLQSKPGLVVVINAHENLRHRQVIWLMDEARKAGATQLAIATDGEQSNLKSEISNLKSPKGSP